MKKILPLLLLAITFTACKKTNIQLYDTKSDIYFNNYEDQPYDYWIEYLDSYNFSFGQDPSIKEGSVEVAISISGSPSNDDRLFVLVVDKDSSTAVEGIDFKLPSKETLFVPGGTVGTKFFVTLIKTDALLEKPAKLVLKLLPNESFNTLIEFRKSSYYNNLIISGTSFTITFDNVLPEPKFWNDFLDYLGEYSQAKYLLLLETNNLSLDSDLEGLGGPYFQTLATKTQMYLNEQAALGNIIKERDGTVMVMGPKVQ